MEDGSMRAMCGRHPCAQQVEAQLTQLKQATHEQGERRKRTAGIAHRVRLGGRNKREAGSKATARLPRTGRRA